MGRGVNKIIRVVFGGTKCECPDCGFMGNFTQVKLHMKATHKFVGTVGRQRTSENCTLCGLRFPNRKEVQNHMLNSH